MKKRLIPALCLVLALLLTAMPAMAAGYVSVSLSAGSCTICGVGNCTRPSGAPCRHAGKIRYSIESLGGNVGLTCRKLMGLQLEWIEDGKVPSYFVLCAGLLWP